jgi:hypothetical protein
VDACDGDEEEPRSLHRYIYGADEPVNQVDPSGRFYGGVSETFVVNVGLQNVGRSYQSASNITLAHRIVAALAAAGMVAGSISPVPILGSEDNKGQGGEILYRRPAGRESVTRLARKAAEAEEEMGLHGVSAFCVPLSDSSRALRSEVEMFFSVMDTRGPNHRTILLPRPVTKEVADTFNRVFGRP